jgi:hypothetical protein
MGWGTRGGQQCADRKTTRYGGVTRLEMWAAAERRLAFVRRVTSCTTGVLLQHCREIPLGGGLLKAE